MELFGWAAVSQELWTGEESHLSHEVPKIDLASNGDEYQESVGEGGGGCWSTVGVYGWQSYLHLWGDCLEYVGASTFHNPIGLQGLLRG
jgi:hypothetical protein